VSYINDVICSLQKAYLGELEHAQEVRGFPEASTDHDLRSKSWIIDWAVVEFPKDRAQSFVCCHQYIISSNSNIPKSEWDSQGLVLLGRLRQ